jgi:penicillin-binding protein 2
VRLPGITVVGKTGTVQVYKASSGVDSDKLSKEKRDHGWFIGYAPMEKPTIAFAVLVEHGGHGGTISAPVVRKVLEVYFGLPPREEPSIPGAPAHPADRTQVARAQIR